MEKIYKIIISNIESLTRLAESVYELKQQFDEENGKKMIQIVDNCEEKFLKVKEELTIMIKELETKESKTDKLSVTETENGFLIKE